MNVKKMALWLKLMIAISAIFGIIFYGYFFPIYCKDYLTSLNYWSCLTLIWLTSIPCFTVLFFSFRIANNLNDDNMFSLDTAKSLRIIASLAVGDTILFFLGNIVLLLFNYSEISIIMLSLVVLFIGVFIGVITSVLSFLIKKAAVLREENDLTV